MSESVNEFDVDLYEINGVFIVRNFVSKGEVCSMKERMNELISKWDPEESAG